MMKERVNTSNDTLQDTFHRMGSTVRYLQCISMQYRPTDEVRTKIMVVREVINSVMMLIKEIEGCTSPGKLAKWKTSNPTASLCSRIGKGAKNTLEYIDDFNYGSGNARNVPGRQNYIRFQLTFAHNTNFNNFLDEVNARLPELHKTNKMFKAFSNCKNYVVGGVLMWLHWKYIRTWFRGCLLTWEQDPIGTFLQKPWTVET